jgi:hypothetical protein
VAGALVGEPVYAIRGILMNDVAYITIDEARPETRLLRPDLEKAQS